MENVLQKLIPRSKVLLHSLLSKRGSDTQENINVEANELLNNQLFLDDFNDVSLTYIIGDTDTPFVSAKSALLTLNFMGKYLVDGYNDLLKLVVDFIANAEDLDFISLSSAMVATDISKLIGYGLFEYYNTGGKSKIYLKDIFLSFNTYKKLLPKRDKRDETWKQYDTPSTEGNEIDSNPPLREITLGMSKSNVDIEYLIQTFNDIQKHIELNPLEYHLSEQEKNTEGGYNRNSLVSYLAKESINNFNVQLIMYFIKVNFYNKSYATTAIIKSQNVPGFYMFMKQSKYSLTIEDMMNVIETDNNELFKMALQLFDMDEIISNPILFIIKAYTCGSLNLLISLLTITKYKLSPSDIKDVIPSKDNVDTIEYIAKEYSLLPERTLEKLFSNPNVEVFDRLFPYVEVVDLSYQPILRNMVVNDEQDILTSKILNRYPSWKSDPVMQAIIIRTVKPVSLSNILTDYSLSSDILKEAFAYSDYRILDILPENVLVSAYAMENACSKGNINVIKLLVKKYKLPLTIFHLTMFFKKTLTKLPDDILELSINIDLNQISKAIIKGDIDTVVKFGDLYGYSFSLSDLMLALLHSKKEIVEYMENVLMEKSNYKGSDLLNTLSEIKKINGGLELKEQSVKSGGESEGAVLPLP